MKGQPLRLWKNQVCVHLHIHFKIALLHMNLCFFGFSDELVITSVRFLHLINELNKFFDMRSLYVCIRVILLLKNYLLTV